MNQGCIDCHILLWNGHSYSAHAIDVDDTASIDVSSAVDETEAVECSINQRVQILHSLVDHQRRIVDVLINSSWVGVVPMMGRDDLLGEY